MEALQGRSNATWIIILSFLLAAYFTIFPLPEWAEVFRPEWVALFLIYWVMALPHRIGLLTAWLLGIFLDVLQGTLLGLNAMTLAVVAYVAMSLYQRLRMFTLLQQSATVLVLVGLHELLAFWVLTASGESTAPNLTFMLSALSSAVVWPFVFVFLRYLRRSFEVK